MLSCESQRGRVSWGCKNGLVGRIAVGHSTSYSSGLHYDHSSKGRQVHRTSHLRVNLRILAESLKEGDRRGSNPRPSGPQPDALPTELRSPGSLNILAARSGRAKPPSTPQAMAIKERRADGHGSRARDPPRVGGSGAVTRRGPMQAAGHDYRTGV